MINAFKLDSIYFWFRPWLAPTEFSKLICGIAFEINQEFTVKEITVKQTSTFQQCVQSSRSSEGPRGIYGSNPLVVRGLSPAVTRDHRDHVYMMIRPITNI